MMKKSGYQGILTQEQYDALLPALTNFSEERKQACYLVMVKGLPATEVANQFSKTRQWLNDALIKVYDKYVQVNYPSDWQTITVRVPPHIAVLIRGMEQKALDLLKQQLRKIN